MNVASRPMHLLSLCAGVGMAMNRYTWRPVATEVELRQLYEVERQSLRSVASKLNCSAKAVSTTLKHYGIPLFPAAPRHTKGENCYAWKGDKASYKSFHLRIAKARGKPQACEVCGLDDPAARYEWANLSGNYQDIYDYKRMCQPCHRKHDKTILNIPAEFRGRGRQ